MMLVVGVRLKIYGLNFGVGIFAVPTFLSGRSPPTL